MGAPIRPTLTLMLGGTSLTAGRLCTPPLPWTYYLAQDMRASPYCKGPVCIINTGKGSQTSNFGATEAARMAPLRPDYVLMEDFGINDCAIGPVSIPQATINFNSMVASYRAANAAAVLAHQTMSPASAGDASRTNLASYYDNGLANAVLNDMESLDNYDGTLLVPGGWPKPLDPNITVGAGYIPATPSGFLAISAGEWQAKSADITLTGNNLIATRTASSGPAFAAARANQSVSSGKWYFEATCTLGTGQVTCGIGTTSSSLNDQVGTDVTSWGFSDDGNVYNNGIVASYGSFLNGTLIGVAIDLVNNRIWFRKNGGVWNGSALNDPTTNVGGLAISAGTYYPMISTQDVGNAWTAVFGNGDGLHPIWPDAFEIYSYPNILAWAEQIMQDYWP